MFCNKIKSRLKALLQQFDSYVDTHIDTALSITTALRNALASPVADIITAIIPGNVDDAIRAQLEVALGKAVEALTIAADCQGTDTEARVKCFVQELQQRDPNLRDALLQKLASLLAGNLDGQRLAQSLYDLYTQAKYTAGK